jgi:hypothetical protein
MQQPPLHLVSARALAIPGFAASPAWLGWALRLLAATAFIEMACMSPPVASWLNRSTDSNARCPLRCPAGCLNGHILLALRAAPRSPQASHQGVMGPGIGGALARSALANASSAACRPDRSDMRTCLTATAGLLHPGFGRANNAKGISWLGDPLTYCPQRRDRPSGHTGLLITDLLLTQQGLPPRWMDLRPPMESSTARPTRKSPSATDRRSVAPPDDSRPPTAARCSPQRPARAPSWSRVCPCFSRYRGTSGPGPPILASAASS